MNINSAADVRTVFPGAEITSDKLVYQDYPVIVADGDNLSIEGILQWEDIEALAYWKAHRDEFATQAKS